MKVQLYSHEGPGGRTTVSLETNDDGSILVFFHDVGEVALETYGDNDYEAWITIPPGAVPALCYALMREALGDRSDAVSWLGDFCSRHGIEHEVNVWT